MLMYALVLSEASCEDPTSRMHGTAIYENFTSRTSWKTCSQKRKRYTAPICLYKNHCITFQLLLSGDIELNPGPNQNISCSACEKTIRKNTPRFDCRVCKDATHAKCTTTTTPHRLLQKVNYWTSSAVFLQNFLFTTAHSWTKIDMP